MVMIDYKSYCKHGLVIPALIYTYYQSASSAMHNIDHKNHLLCVKHLIETCTRCIDRVSEEEKLGYFEMRITYVKMYLWDMLLYGENYDVVKSALNSLIDRKIYPYKVNRTVKKGRNGKEAIAKFM